MNRIYKLQILLPALILLLTASCTDDLGMRPAPSEKEIGLGAVTATPTKAAVSALPDDAVLNVSAALSLDGETSDWFTAAPFSKDGTVWKGSSPKYWPLSGTLDFLAWWMPTLHPTVAWGSPAASSLTLAVPSNKDAQDDLLVGWLPAATSSGNPAVLPLRHAYAQVAFMASCDDYDAATNSGITVDGIDILGAAHAGTCTVNPAAETIAWSALSATSDASVPGISSVLLATAAQPLGTPMLFPAQAARSFRIRYTLHNGKKADGSTADDHACVYDYVQPSGAEAWGQGRRYLYAISFSMEGITVTPSVTPWQEAPPVRVEVQGVPDETLDYLRFEVTSDGRITWTATAARASRTLEYSINDAAWQQLTSTTTGASIIVHNGDVIKWRGRSDSYYESGGDWSAFGTEDGAMFDVAGDAMSLLYPEDFETATALPNTKNIFRNLFRGCGGVTSAADMQLRATALRDSCYAGMFYDCSMLSTGPALPATTLSPYCYAYMFSNCTGLVEAPALRATAVNSRSYQHMFSSCISLAAAPDLPATSLAAYCYSHMFDGCVSLTEVPDVLPAAAIRSYCYEYMFYGCAALRRAPRIAATSPMNGSTLQSYYFRYMFGDCVSLEAAPALPMTRVGSYGYYGMFQNCSAIVDPPALPATSISSYCYGYMFSGCLALSSAPALPARTLAAYCYRDMFRHCESLPACPALPATTLKDGVYYEMFSYCYSLTETAELPALTATYNCYAYMYSHCHSLTVAHDLPATKVQGNAYMYMFSSCFALVTAPQIAVKEFVYQNSAGTTTYSQQMYGMFYSCTMLETPPAHLDPPIGRSYSYYRMFYNCSKLKTAPTMELTSFTANRTCYEMFRGCSSLEEAPVLKAKTLRDYSYYAMFYGCSKLKKITCLAEDIDAFRCLNSWLYNTAGSSVTSATFVQAPAMEGDGGPGTTRWPRSTSGIPSSSKWAIETYTE